VEKVIERNAQGPGLFGATGTTGAQRARARLNRLATTRGIASDVAGNTPIGHAPQERDPHEPPHVVMQELPVPIVGDSVAMRRVIDLCRKVAPCDISVLLHGETGTGKELFAQLLHIWSPRAGKPMVTINCAAIPESLIESELFGHERGAFTGAVSARKGKFELADGGTIVLDEIGEMPLAMQAKLLRVLENHKYHPVGGLDEREVDVRVIASTNRDLSKEVAAGRFREDLFYRLNSFQVVLPPLVERVSDIPLLAEHFASLKGKETGKGPLDIAHDTIACLCSHRWRGNIRELKNVMDRAAVLADSVIEPCHLPAEMWHHAGQAITADSLSMLSALEMQERAMVLRALEENDWNKAAAARQLGISWDNLRYRVKKYHLRQPTKGGLHHN